MSDASFYESLGGPVCSVDDKSIFESTIAAMRSEIANVGSHAAIDGATRAAYDAQVSAMANELRRKVGLGQMTWAQAATEASSVRNTVMEAMRGRSTPVGRALAQSIKAEGKTLNQLIARKAVQLFGEGVDFSTLSPQQQNRVYSEIVKSAGKSNPAITAQMRNLSRAGRGLIFLSLAISVYTVATAEDKGAALVREGAVTGAGIAGGAAGGALAGLACGPGAPACVVAGAFIGGALAAFGVDYAFF